MEGGQKREIKIIRTENIEKFVEQMGTYVRGNLKVAFLQLNTLIRMNDATLQVYDKNKDKVALLRDEVEKTSKIYDNLKQYYAKIDEVSRTIDGLESSVDYLNVILTRTEEKLNDIEKVG